MEDGGAVTLTSLFNDAAIKHASNTAVVFDDGDCESRATYSHISRLSDVVKHHLKGRVASTGVVGLILKPGLHIPVAIIGVLRAGAAFLSVDRQWPPSRLLHLCATLRLTTLLVDRKLVNDFVGRLNSLQPAVTEIDTELSFVAVQLAPHGGAEEKRREKGTGSLAYVVTTSATTGQPKVVMVPHKCICPNITQLSALFAIVPSDVVLLSSPLTFDPSIVDLFMCLSRGASLLIVTDAVKLTPDLFSDVVLTKHRTTVVQATPSLVRHLAGAAGHPLLSDHSPVRVLAFGGEPCPDPLVLARWRHPANATRLYNLYGVSEVSCWATCHRITDADLRSPGNGIPLGRPLVGTCLEIDQTDEENAGDCTGILWIGGVERVCHVDGDPGRHTDGGAVLRSSGDVVTRDQDGRLWYVGRRDEQTKRFGQRINLLELEAVASSSACVRLVAAVMTNQRLRLFVSQSHAATRPGIGRPPAIGLHGGALSEEGRTALDVCRVVGSTLPPVYHPDRVVVIDKFPITRHGKADKKMLSSAIRNPDDSTEFCWNELLSWHQPLLEPPLDGGLLLEPSLDGGLLLEPRLDGGLQPQPPLDGGLQPEPRLDGGSQAEPPLDGGSQPRPSLDGGSRIGPPLDGGSQLESPLDGGSQPEPQLDGGLQLQPSLDGGLQLQPSLDRGSQPQPSLDGGSPLEPSSDGGSQPRPSLDGSSQVERPLDGGTLSSGTDICAAESVEREVWRHVNFIWPECVRSDLPVRPSLGFAQQGGDSLHALHLADWLERALAVALPLCVDRLLRGSMAAALRYIVQTVLSGRAEGGRTAGGTAARAPTAATSRQRAAVSGQRGGDGATRSLVVADAVDGAAGAEDDGRSDEELATDRTQTDSRSRRASVRKAAKEEEEKSKIRKEADGPSDIRVPRKRRRTSNDSPDRSVPGRRCGAPNDSRGLRVPRELCGVSDNRPRDYSDSPRSLHGEESVQLDDVGGEPLRVDGSRVLACVRSSHHQGGYRYRYRVGALGRGVGTNAKHAPRRCGDPSLPQRPFVSDVWRNYQGRCVDASPLIVILSDGEGVVYIGSHSHTFAAIALRSGVTLWEVPLPAPVQAAAVLSRDAKYVIVGCYTGHVFCLRAATGQPHWTFATGGAIKGAACVDFSTGFVYLGSDDKHMYALDVQSRSCLWCVRPSEGAIVCAPVVSGRPRHALYTATLSGHLVTLRPVTGAVLWSRCLGKPLFASPAVTVTTVFVTCVDGCLYGFSHDGDQTWFYQCGGALFTSPSLSPAGASSESRAGCVVFGCDDCHVYCVTHAGELLWRFVADSRVYATPFVLRVARTPSTSCRPLSLSGSHSKERSDEGANSNGVALRTTDGRSGGGGSGKEQGEGSREGASGDVLGAEEEEDDDGRDPGKKQGEGSREDGCGDEREAEEEGGDAVVAVFSCRGVFYLLDGTSGRVLASRRLPADVFSSPVVVTDDASNDVFVVVGCRDDNVHCLRLSSASVHEPHIARIEHAKEFVT